MRDEPDAINSTSGSVTPSSAGGRRRFAWASAGVLVLAAFPLANQLLTREEALAAVYPGSEIRIERVFLTPDQQKRAAKLAGVAIPSALVARYIATKGRLVVGRAYVDTHVVRTKRQSLLVSLDTEGLLKRIDVTAFLEPPEYMAPEPWLQQYPGRSLTDDLNLQRAIRPIAGATLTARATTEAARRVLAIDRVLRDDMRPEEIR